MKYFTGEGVLQDATEAVRWFRLAAEQGHAIAQYNLGVKYDTGEGVPKDYAEAVRWFRLAAEQGDASAQYNLGIAYDTGEGVLQDSAEAHMWLNLAASRSSGADRARSVGARDRVAKRMTPADLSEAQRRAREWHAAHTPPVQAQDNPSAQELADLRALAEQGDASAQINLGVKYDTGEGVPQDYVEAVRWFRLAAEQGDASAQINLGVMYDTGEGVPEDDVEAVRWFRLAAEQGDAKAQHKLGRMYDFGMSQSMFRLFGTDKDVPQDDVEAHMWFSLAASRSSDADRELSVLFRDSVAKRMTPADLSEAQRRAREWHAAHTVP